MCFQDNAFIDYKTNRVRILNEKAAEYKVPYHLQMLEEWKFDRERRLAMEREEEEAANYHESWKEKLRPATK